MGEGYRTKFHNPHLGPIGADGHDGSDGSTPFDRMNRYGNWEVSPGSRAGENLSYGPLTIGRWHVIQWVVDDGVLNRGHRQAILRPDYRFTGIACDAHAVYGTMCSMTYASDYGEESTSASGP